MHILVVEDEQRLAFLLRRVLLEERHTVDLAHDGPSGLDLALSDTYDVLVLDVMLPGFDGIEICRQMRTERIICFQQRANRPPVCLAQNLKCFARSMEVVV